MTAKWLTPDLDDTTGGHQNGSSPAGDEDKDQNELNPPEQNPHSNNSAKVKADQAFTFQGSPIFNNPQFYFGDQRSTGPEPPNNAKHQKFYRWGPAQ